MTSNKQVGQFLKTVHFFSYLTISLYLIINFFSIEWGQIFSVNGLLIFIVILATHYLLYRTAPKNIDFGGILGLLFITGGLVFLVFVWAAKKLNLYAITDTFHNYKGIVTRHSNKTVTTYTHTPGPHGGDIDESEEYVDKPVYRELYNKTDDISNAINNYQSSNEFVTERSYTFWQIAFLEGFKVDSDKLTTTQKPVFKLTTPFLYIVETFLKTIPLIILIAIIEIVFQLVAKGKKSISQYVRSSS